MFCHHKEWLKNGEKFTHNITIIFSHHSKCVQILLPKIKYFLCSLIVHTYKQIINLKVAQSAVIVVFLKENAWCLEENRYNFFFG